VEQCKTQSNVRLLSFKSCSLRRHQHAALPGSAAGTGP